MDDRQMLKKPYFTVSITTQHAANQCEIQRRSLFLIQSHICVHNLEKMFFNLVAPTSRWLVSCQPPHPWGCAVRLAVCFSCCGSTAFNNTVGTRRVLLVWQYSTTVASVRLHENCRKLLQVSAHQVAWNASSHRVTPSRLLSVVALGSGMIIR